MTDEQINERIAEVCGWVDCRVVQKATLGVCKPVAYGRPNEYGHDVVCPSFATDLNAMHEAEKVLGEKRVRSYALTLAQMLDTSPTVDLDDQFLNIHATARQRAEAFLRTIRKWEEVQK